MLKPVENTIGYLVRELVVFIYATIICKGMKLHFSECLYMSWRHGREVNPSKSLSFTYLPKIRKPSQLTFMQVSQMNCMPVFLKDHVQHKQLLTIWEIWKHYLRGFGLMAKFLLLSRYGKWGWNINDSLLDLSQL
jgi:hypothetical protein